MEVLKYVDLEVDGIDTSDYPKFCDAYVSAATAVLSDGSTREATDDELEKLSEDYDLVHQLVYEYLY